VAHRLFPLRCAAFRRRHREEQPAPRDHRAGAQNAIALAAARPMVPAGGGDQAHHGRCRITPSWRSGGVRDARAHVVEIDAIEGKAKGTAQLALLQRAGFVNARHSGSCAMAQPIGICPAPRPATAREYGELKAARWTFFRNRSRPCGEGGRTAPPVRDPTIFGDDIAALDGSGCDAHHGESPSRPKTTVAGSGANDIAIATTEHLRLASKGRRGSTQDIRPPSPSPRR